MKTRKIEIVVGTYEEFLIGYDLIISQDGKLSFNQSFTDHSHTGSVRQVAISGNYLVSGATDEIVRIYDLHKRVEVGLIMEHQGTITCLAFHNTEYLFSASEDGNICIFKRGKWQCEKVLKAHAGGVTGFAVHPSGKLALSVGKDKSLHTWNLIKGRRAFITNLKTVADSVHWSPDGTHYLVVKNSCIDNYDVASGRKVHSVDFKQPVHDTVFITDDIIAVGGEGNNICLYDVANGMEVVQWEAHSLRIKSLRLIPQDIADEVWLVSSSSDGKIKIWKLELLTLSSSPQLVGEVNTNCRVICMDIYFSHPTGSKANDGGQYEDADTEDIPDSGEGEEDSDESEEEVVKETKKRKKKKILQTSKRNVSEGEKQSHSGKSVEEKIVKKKKKKAAIQN